MPFVQLLQDKRSFCYLSDVDQSLWSFHLAEIAALQLERGLIVKLLIGKGKPDKRWTSQHVNGGAAVSDCYPLLNDCKPSRPARREQHQPNQPADPIHSAERAVVHDPCSTSATWRRVQQREPTMGLGGQTGKQSLKPATWPQHGLVCPILTRLMAVKASRTGTVCLW